MSKKIPKETPLAKQFQNAVAAVTEIIKENADLNKKIEYYRKHSYVPHGRKGKGLPAPRIEFEYMPDENGSWYCHKCFYYLVIPLRDIDIRREEGDKKPYDEFYVPVSYTSISGSDRSPVYEINLPFRDGAHAGWDQEALGTSFPVYATCGDKSYLVPKRDKPATPATPATP